MKTKKEKCYYDYYGNKIEDSQTLDILKLYNKKMSKNISSIKREVLQEAVITMLSKSKTIETGKTENLFNTIQHRTTVNKWRQDSKDNHFEELQDDYNIGQVFSKDYRDFLDTIDYIKSKLTDTEYQLFNLYHVNKFSQHAVSIEFGKSQQQISRDINKLNNKLHRLRIKELYRLDLVAPCLTQDKKHGKYRPTLPNTKAKKYKSKVLGKTIVNHAEAATIKREYGPWKGQIAYIYSCPVSQKKQYEGKKIEYKASEKINNIENLPCNFISTNFFTPIVNKPLFDDIDFCVIDNAYALEYKTRKRALTYKGDLNNYQGACFNFNKINTGYFKRSSKIKDRIKMLYRRNQINIVKQF